jgi:hypothetical protein
VFFRAETHRAQIGASTTTASALSVSNPIMLLVLLTHRLRAMPSFMVRQMRILPSAIAGGLGPGTGRLHVMRLSPWHTSL